MRVNESLAISTNKVLLVPYEAHHVIRYHGWMQDPDIQEATASEPLSLDEEFENQQSWRTSHDKLTFILAEPLSGPSHSDSETGARILKARVCDSAPRIKGDVNFFLYPDDDEEEENDERHIANEEHQAGEMRLRGEVDVMVAEKDARGNGMGSAAVRALIVFVRRHVKGILAEYARGIKQPPSQDDKHEHEDEQGPTFRLTSLMAKIKQENVGSRALFAKLGFEQLGGVDYFGEVKMVLDRDAVEEGGRWEEEMRYEELVYRE